jgi:hypothetical protein
VRAAAARNNAEWCAAVFRTHGINSQFHEKAWCSDGPVPPYYPNAVSLTPDARPTDLLSYLHPGPGTSIKDSFAHLDLRDQGFVELFDATWVYRLALADPATTVLHTEKVSTPTALAQWVKAWSQDGPPVDVFRPALLADRNISLLAVLDDEQVVGGAALNLAAGVVGISNVFGDDTRINEVWQAAVASAATEFPGVELVGYESGDDLAPALATGFTPVGGLGIWVRQ